MTCAAVVAAACQPPADVGVPVTHWSAALLAGHLADVGLVVSATSVRRILTTALLQPHRQKMWLTSHDDEFRARRDEILHVYYASRRDEHVICVDEKTQMQALERRHADVPMAPGQPVRREWEYVRHGVVALHGAFDVRTGTVFGFVCEEHNEYTFLDLLNQVDAAYPSGRGHLVMDNLAAHDTDEIDAWFEEHPRWTRHFTPRHASWLNQIECWFGMLQRHVIARGSFPSRADLTQKVLDYMLWHNEHAAPFEWTYRPKSWKQKTAPAAGGRN